MGSESDNLADRRVAGAAAEEWGVLSLAELRHCGLTKRAIAVRVRRGWLHRLHQGVYAVGHARIPLEGRFLAAVKACGPGAVLSHYSAASLLGMVQWEERFLEVTVCDTTPRVHRGIRVHRTRCLEHRDVRDWHGIPVTSPARTALDLASQLPFHAARRATRQALSLGLLSVGDLLEILHRQGTRPGARTLRRIVAGGVMPTRSLLEDVVLELILEAGLAMPDVNLPMVLDGRRVVPDFRWPELRLVVEADGAAWHDNELARHDDAERQAILERAGERVLRVSWRQAIGRRAQTITRLREAGGAGG
jgi:Transcriptional regulator, AbiEi antitoxin/Protein of unknown function (DUF559)